MQPLFIYIVRHGQTQFNVEGHVQGWGDSPLTDLGKYQAKCTGTGLKGIDFAKAYTGSSSRQYDTGKILLEYSGNSDTEIIRTDLFREMGYGDFESRTVREMMDAASEVLGCEIQFYASKNEECTPYDISRTLGEMREMHTESIEDSSARLMKGIEMVLSENQDGGNVLIATSACAMDITVKTLFPQTVHYRLPSNCCVTKIRYLDGKFELLDFGDISYREKGEKELNEIQE